MPSLRNTTRLLVHIGGPKCGSSALQKFLSANPVLDMQDGRTLRYVAYSDILNRFVGGETLKGMAAHAPGDYLVARNILEGCRCSELQEYLDKELPDDAVCALSWEGFVSAPPSFFEPLQADIEVVLYIRPQAPLFNSAWWQWGAWSGVTLDEFIDNSIKGQKYFWSKVVDRYRTAPCVKKIHVRILSGDIVEDFVSHFAIHHKLRKDGSIHNRSLPGTILRVYQRNRFLRRTPHNSPIDFSLESKLGYLKDSTPWVLGPEQIERIREGHHQDNQRLAGMLEKDQLQLMRKDSRWFSPKAKDSVESPAPVESGAPELDTLTAAALNAVFSLHTSVRNLEAFLGFMERVLQERGMSLARDIFADLPYEQRSEAAYYCHTLSQHYRRTEKRALALKMAGEAVLLCDSVPQFQLNYSELLLENNDLKAAEQSARKAVELAPENARHHYQLSCALMQKNELEEALKSAKAAVSLEQASAPMYFHLGQLLLRTDDLEEAEKAFQKALALHEGHPGYHFHLSRVYSRAGKLEPALENAAAAARLNGENPGFHHHLGKLLQKAGRPSEAREAFKRAVELAPANQLFRKSLAELLQKS